MNAAQCGVIERVPLALLAGLWLLAAAPAALSDEPTSSPQPTATPAPAAATPSADDAKAEPKTEGTGAEPKVAAAKDADTAPELQGRVYVDEDYDFKVGAPDGWVRANPKNFSVAGELCRVWTPGSETAIMVYRVVSEEPFLPLGLLDQTAELMVEKRHATVLEQEIRTISGKQAAWLVLSGPGNGGAIEGQGLITTVQHMVAVPRKNDTLIFMMGTPEKNYPKYRPVFDKLVDSLEIGGAQNEAQQADS
jgi:hypothetical protein